MSAAEPRPFRVLFLCTGNSARSQMAEAILNSKGRGRFVAASAGSAPAPRVNPHAIAALREVGIDWAGHSPRGMEGLERQQWDSVITVCDRAKESCPVLPGQPVMEHWSVPDPADARGTEAEMQQAFRDALLTLSLRIDLLLALPVEKLERLALEKGVQSIGKGSATEPLRTTP